MKGTHGPTHVGTPGAADQPLNTKGTFSLFPIRDQRKTTTFQACLLMEKSWMLCIRLGWDLQEHLRELHYISLTHIY